MALTLDKPVYDWGMSQLYEKAEDAWAPVLDLKR
jgi:hypothetical protein